MSFVLEPSIARLPGENFDRAGWSASNVQHCEFVIGFLKGALKSLRAWSHGDVRDLETGADTCSLSTTSHRIRCALERAYPDSTVQVRISVEPVTGRRAVIEYPARRARLDGILDKEVPLFAEQAIACGIAQLEAVSLLYDDERWEPAAAILSLHLQKLVASNRIAGFRDPEAIAVFPDGAAPRTVKVFDLFDDDCETIEFVAVGDEGICPSPGHARMVRFSQQMNEDGTAFIAADIGWPRTVASPGDMPDNPIDFARILRQNPVPDLMEAGK